MLPTLLRDCLGVGLYFVANELQKSTLHDPPHTPASTATSSPLARLVLPSVRCSPLTRQKSVLQTDIRGKYRGFADCTQQLVNRHVSVISFADGRWRTRVASPVPPSRSDTRGRDAMARLSAGGRAMTIKIHLTFVTRSFNNGFLQQTSAGLSLHANFSHSGGKLARPRSHRLQQALVWSSKALSFLMPKRHIWSWYKSMLSCAERSTCPVHIIVPPF